MHETTVTTPSELEIRVERVFDAPREHVFSVWTDPDLIPEWWGDQTVVEEMDVRPGGKWRFNTGYGVVEGEFREIEPPAWPRADVPEPRADPGVRGPRRADEAHADDALRVARGARHDHAVRRRGGRERRIPAGRRGLGEAHSDNVTRGAVRPEPRAAPRPRAQRAGRCGGRPPSARANALRCALQRRRRLRRDERALRPRAARREHVPSTRHAPTGRLARSRAAAARPRNRGRGGAPARRPPTWPAHDRPRAPRVPTGSRRTKTPPAPARRRDRAVYRSRSAAGRRASGWAHNREARATRAAGRALPPGRTGRRRAPRASRSAAAAPPPTPARGAAGAPTPRGRRPPPPPPPAPRPP